MRTYLSTTNGTNYADMYADSTCVASYSDSKKTGADSSTCTTDAGFEWNNTNGLWQGVSLPSKMEYIQQRVNGTWIPWNNYTVSFYDSHSGVTTSYDNSTYSLNFK